MKKLSQWVLDNFKKRSYLDEIKFNIYAYSREEKIRECTLLNAKGFDVEFHNGGNGMTVTRK